GAEQVPGAGVESVGGGELIGGRFAGVLNGAVAQRVARLVKQRQFGVLQVVEGRIERREGLFKLGEELRKAGCSQLLRLGLRPGDADRRRDGQEREKRQRSKSHGDRRS